MPRRPEPPTGDETRDRKNQKERERRARIRQRQQRQQPSDEAAGVTVAAASSSSAAAAEESSSSSSTLLIFPKGSVQRVVTIKVKNDDNSSSLEEVKLFSYIDLINAHLEEEGIEHSTEYSTRTLGRLLAEYGAHDLFEEVRTICPNFLVSARITDDEAGLAVHYHQFEGQGQRPTPCGTLQSCVELLMLLPGKRGAAVRRAGAKAIIGILGGDESVIEQVKQSKRIQEHLSKHDPDNPWRIFATAAASKKSEEDSCTDELSLQKKKRQLEIEIEDMEREAKIRREESEHSASLRRQEREREAQLKKEEQEREAQLKKDEQEREAQLKKEEQEREAQAKREDIDLKKEERQKKHVSVMQKHTLDEEKTRSEHKSFVVEKARREATDKIEVQKMLDEGLINQKQADELLGTQRVLLTMCLGDILSKIWEGANVTIRKDLPRNYAQHFYEAYATQKNQFFADKPHGDFTQDLQRPPQNVKWYDADLQSMWRFAESLYDDELKRRRAGSAPLQFFAGQQHQQRLSRSCPSLADCRQKLGL